MAVGREGAALRQIRTLFDVGASAGLSDGELLARFNARRGEGAELAFAALVERHGPMVLRTCRAILRDEHDAQDAFQATFLVLARRAGTLWVRDSLGPWLHRVARRVAARARGVEDRRRAAERRAAEGARASRDDPARDDLRATLHEEIDRLPGRYRVPIVLCCLEGRTYDQAACLLGWPVGTLHSRLARGRARLRARLTRRGLAPSAVLLGAASASRAAPPTALAAATARAAASLTCGRWTAGAFPATMSASAIALTEGALRMMFLAKLKGTILALAVVGGLSAGAAVLAQRAEPRDPSRPAGATATPRLKFQIRTWKDGKESGAPVVVDATAVAGTTYQVETPEAVIQIRPRALRGELRIDRPRHAEEERVKAEEQNRRLIQDLKDRIHREQAEEARAKIRESERLYDELVKRGSLLTEAASAKIEALIEQWKFELEKLKRLETGRRARDRGDPAPDPRPAPRAEPAPAPESAPSPDESRPESAPSALGTVNLTLADGIRGFITAVDPDPSFGVLDRGSDDSLIVGQELHVYRKPGPGQVEEVGKFLILRTEPDQSVGKLIDAAPGRKLTVGDIITVDEAEGPKPGKPR